ncbi:DNA translocase FtsK [Lacticaseibacillus hulanensis]|uniref:DNA translocase FtsK n=1 Tax=Lacticaseibacillus hulanensis TaxID=2493111 RepID=UPI000FD8456B|nr:DNA translocase FtsK [Lacticaseibacillus hulanensis]
MPQTKRRKVATRRSTARKPRRKTGDYTINWFGAGITVFGLLALTKLGMLGVTLANVLRLIGGDTYMALGIAFVFTGVWMVIAGKVPPLRKRVVWGILLMYIAAVLGFSAHLMEASNVHAHFWSATWFILKTDFAALTAATPAGGGLLGAALYTVTYPLLSQVGSYVLAGLIAVVGLCMFFGVEPAQIFDLLHRIGHALLAGWHRITTAISDWHERQLSNQDAAGKRQSRTQKNTAKHTGTQEDKSLPKAHDHDEPLVGQVDDPEPEFTINVADTPAPDPANAAFDEPTAQAPASQESKADQADAPEIITGDPTDDYRLPPLDILSQPKPVDQREEQAAIRVNRGKLERTFASFGVDVKVTAATLGPSITKYEIQPAIGVKVSKIVNLADDLALALAAKDIRIEAPIPGKSLIGIEVPNQHIRTVGYKDVLRATPPHPDKPLEVPLGQDVAGSIVTADLAKMPHMLIAGATGSGKSVMINVIITSLLMRAKPTDVRLMLIDPKKVELSVYDGVPHLLAPVVTEAKRAPAALNKILQEMERRYERFSAAGVRNMGEYNRKVAENPDEGLSKMPYIVVIVDELADLMMVAGAEVETAIIRIGQMARAAGIHMIIATQRPSVDVITGLIKANIPSRMAFAVSSGVDSRTILDANGAEKLLGRGDMLYDPIDMNKPQRVQGAFIPSADVEAVVKYITDQVKPAYDEAMIPTAEDEKAEDGGNSDDELFDDALKFVREKQSASTSMLQRRFRIGYNRAARLIDDLENRGYIGPAEGSKPRKVYSKPEQQ